VRKSLHWFMCVSDTPGAKARESRSADNGTAKGVPFPSVLI
jgi:hypothetical protein